MKPGIKTSELWLVVALSVAALVLNALGYSADEMRQYGQITVAKVRGAVIEWTPVVLAAAYIIQRGAIKIAELWARVRSGELPVIKPVDLER